MDRLSEVKYIAGSKSKTFYALIFIALLAIIFPTIFAVKTGKRFEDDNNLNGKSDDYHAGNAFVWFSFCIVILSLCMPIILFIRNEGRSVVGGVSIGMSFMSIIALTIFFISIVEGKSIYPPKEETNQQ